MILYFSGTGNSRYIAEVINSVIEDKLVSINECLKNNLIVSLEQQYSIVCPTYAWRIPRVVEQFIRTNHFVSGTKIYFIMTCGGDIGNAAKYINRLCNEKNMILMGIGEIVMPENFITMFKAPENPEVIISHGVETALLLAAEIKAGKYFLETKPTFIGRFNSGIVNRLFYPMFVRAKGFHVEDTCIGCGQCIHACPLKNISLVDSRPIWDKHCTQCMACISICPKAAIEYKNKTKGKRRYYLKDSYNKEIK